MNEKAINIEQFRKVMATKEEICDGSEMFIIFHKLAQEALQINACCRFQEQGGIEIGDGSLIGHNTTIATLNHDFNPDKRANLHPSPVKIGKNVWIGSDCTILPGVEIGDGAVIGAGSVVTKNIPANSIAVGNPARVIKQIEIK